MKTRYRPSLTSIVALAALLLSVVGFTAQTVAQGETPQLPAYATALVGNAFTYQGVLNDADGAANGNYDLRFILYDAAIGGSQVGVVVTVDAVTVTDGFFSAVLDFGDGALNGEERFLEIAVRPSGSVDAYTSLNPRQALSPVPYAVYTTSAPWNGLVDVPVGFADGVDNDTIYSAGTGLDLTGTAFSLDTTFGDGRYINDGQAAGGALSGTYPAPAIADNAVDTSKIADNAVGSSEIAADAVGSSEIGTNAVGPDEIASLAVTTSDIANDAVNSAKIADGSVTSGDIASNAINSSSLVASGALRLTDLTIVAGGSTFSVGTLASHECKLVINTFSDSRYARGNLTVPIPNADLPSGIVVIPTVIAADGQMVRLLCNFSSSSVSVPQQSWSVPILGRD